MKRSSRPDVLQVEQLFDDRTHPAIHDTLFAGEYGASVPSRPISLPACPGQLTIEEGK